VRIYEKSIVSMCAGSRARIHYEFFTGASSLSRNPAQKSVAPPPLTTAQRTTFGPFFSVTRFDMPSSMTDWRSPYMPITSFPLTHQTEAALESIARRTSFNSWGKSNRVTDQKSTFDVGLQ
jgi:hypothetical protein